MSGVSSALSSGQGGSGGSHAHSHSVGSHAHSHSLSSRGTRSAGAMSVITQSTGNFETTDDEEEQGRERGVSQGSSASGPRSWRAGTVPTPSSSSSSAAAAAALASINIYAPVEFPSLRTRRRVESERAGVIVDPRALYGEGMGSDIEAQHELHGDDNGHPQEGEEEESESERAELEDQVGLLSVPHSPRTSLVGGSRVSLTNSSSSGHGSGEARSRTHSSFSAHSSRSRHSSTRAHSRPRTLSSQAPSVRERAESLGTSMRTFIQGAAAQLDAVMRGATGPAAGLGVGLGGLSSSRPRSRVNSSMARLEEDVVYSPRVTEMGERMRDTSGSSASSGEHAGAVEGEGYSSSGGTHSRSGSESVNGENYTFGRRAFMRPSEQHPPPMVEVEEERDDDEIVLVQRSTGSAGRGTPAALSVPIVSRVDDQAQAQAQAAGEPQSLSTSISGSYYSQQPTERTVSPTTHDATQQHPDSPSPPHSADHSPERQGVDIPWSPQRFLAPPNQRSSHHRAQQEGTASSDSPPDISTAAGSFVTAPATIEGATTTTESSGQRTMSSSWDTNVPSVGMALRRGDVGGMVERPGEDMGAAAGGWRVV
ncbi:hypothetical protein NLJ89_g10585 [Agrocybe chaxingu]|uniref:Uncharacterized protein n=1 Tax=Agrocybe chaxingu TaxID=84603 RepID=A0A9W8MS00_9AGAR|nr:hypothetical protein NLJ89_g10585 [Agrocybe chaxingu]